ncbi:MAG: carboxypeptidase-like regulatory domain-containing protein [Parabacteroides sp.]
MKYSGLLKWAVFLSICWWVNVAVAWAQRDSAAEEEYVVSGIVKDQTSRKKLENVSILLVGTNIGTVSNADGSFSLKIPAEWGICDLEFSHLGYLNTRITADEWRQQPERATVWMTAADNYLDEVVVYGGQAREIVETALQKMTKNYPQDPNLLTLFYRETIQKRHRYIGISEAMMQVYKSPYNRRSVAQDRVQLTKGRRLLSQRRADTLIVKVVGGPSMAQSFDVMKNGDLLFDEVSLDYYAFQQEPSVMLDDRMHYVIRFVPQVTVDYALFIGKLYIDRERQALTRAEFELDLSDRVKAISSILQKKPAGLRFRPVEVSFLVSYRQQGEVTSLHYIRNIIRFKCDWKRLLFSSTYTACSEMVVVDRDEHPTQTILFRDAFRPRQILYDEVPKYWNADYWKDYNIIEPTESLEHAVKKLKKQADQE